MSRRSKAAAPDSSSPEIAEETLRPPSTPPLLAFLASGEHFAVEISQVIEVLRMVAVMPRAKGASDLLGLVDYRGTVVPLLDLALRVGLPRRAPGLDSKIVVVATRSGPLGLVVDEIAGLVSPAAGEYHRRGALPVSELTRASTLVAGALRLSERLVPVLEPDRLLFDDERAKATAPSPGTRRRRPRRAGPQEAP
ncbi:MAG: chemotaxis protein CheW [Deltaproteobacteria bacterium]|nr:chemotaxis protein CheW [Deltaproteobacteria bacterium]